MCSQLVEGMIEAGLTREEALSRFVVCTHHGALGKQDGLKGDPNYKAGMVGEREKVFVNNSVSDGTSLLDAMKVSTVRHPLSSSWSLVFTHASISSRA